MTGNLEDLRRRWDGQNGKMMNGLAPTQTEWPIAMIICDVDKGRFKVDQFFFS